MRLRIDFKEFCYEQECEKVMRKISFYVYGFFAIGLVLCLLFIGNQVFARSLRKITQQDIAFIHKTIFENHPGVKNDHDSDFVKTMDDAYQIAKNSIESMCSFSDYTTIIKEYLLSFRDTHMRFYPKMKETISTTVIENDQIFSITEMLDNIVWITLPTFAPHAEQQKDLEIIITQLPRYREYKVIVFDVRSNTGGSSHWGTRILNALFTKEYASACIDEMNKDIKVDWRVSAENVEYLSSLTSYVAGQFGQDSQEALEIQAVEEGVKKAHKQNKDFYTEQAAQVLMPRIKSNNPVQAKIAVITASCCVSLCLDFIDEVKAVDPQATLIGQVTDADSIYMEVRLVDFPSGKGKLQFPIKMYRNRPRGNNVPYVPDIPYPQNINSKQERDEWLLTTVQNLSQDY